MYLRIEDHGIIGDLYTAALVGVDGTIDWFCAPHFDSPSIFASILDEENGGHFSLRPANNDVRSTQYYLPETNVLVTHFTSDEGVAQIVDFMPVRTRVAGDTDHVLIRRITGDPRQSAHADRLFTQIQLRQGRTRRSLRRRKCSFHLPGYLDRILEHRNT